MIKCELFRDKTVLVFGAGKTGIGAAKSLSASGAKVILADDNIETLKDVAIYNTEVRQTDSIDWTSITHLLLSPGVPLYAPQPHVVVTIAKNRNIKIISDIDVLYLAQPNAKYIGITGTNGKSTTTALIGHILKECGVPTQVGGNIGTSVLELEPLEKGGVYVLELSSYQLDLLSNLKLDTSVFLNISHDHIERHGSFGRYLEAKAKILMNMKTTGTPVISIDYLETKVLANSMHSPITFSIKSNSANVYIENRVLHEGPFTFDFTEQKYLPGKHNEENIVAAYTACRTIPLLPDQIYNAIMTFKGLPHRMQLVYTNDQFVFVNDSKATNADAAEKALVCYNDIYWIAGGLAKEGGINSILNLVKQNVKLSLLVGKAQEEFAASLDKVGAPYVKCDTINNALDYIKSNVTSSGVVLLSPACASWDQYKNFEHRGEEFAQLVLTKFKG
jgi:UDP-N-acetylmuramoylalanine--D-glutamate ligase